MPNTGLARSYQIGPNKSHNIWRAEPIQMRTGCLIDYLPARVPTDPRDMVVCDCTNAYGFAFPHPGLANASSILSARVGPSVYASSSANWETNLGIASWASIDWRNSFASGSVAGAGSPVGVPTNTARVASCRDRLPHSGLAKLD